MHASGRTLRRKNQRAGPREAPPRPPAPHPMLFRSTPTARLPADRSPAHIARVASHAAIRAWHSKSKPRAAAEPILAHWPCAGRPPAASPACAERRHRPQQRRPSRLNHPADMTLRQLRAKRRHRRHRVQHIAHRAQPDYEHTQSISLRICLGRQLLILSRALRQPLPVRPALSGSCSRAVSSSTSTGAIFSRRARCAFVSRTVSLAVVKSTWHRASLPVAQQSSHRGICKPMMVAPGMRCHNRDAFRSQLPRQTPPDGQSRRKPPPLPESRVARAHAESSISAHPSSSIAAHALQIHILLAQDHKISALQSRKGSRNRPAGNSGVRKSDRCSNTISASRASPRCCIPSSSRWTCAPPPASTSVVSASRPLPTRLRPTNTGTPALCAISHGSSP